MPAPGLGKLAFVRGGDVWVKGLPDGDERQLTQDGRNDFPRWLPSGQWLQYRNQRATSWLTRADGSGTRAIAEGAVWSPREDAYAFTSDAGLFLDRVEPTNPRQLLAPAPDSIIGDPVWSADGQWIAYVERRRRSSIPAGTPAFFASEEIGKVKADGTARTTIYRNPDPTKPFHPTRWSPNGAYLLLWHDIFFPSADGQVDGWPLMALPIGGGTPVEVARRVLVYDDFLSWAPVGHRLAFVDAGYRSTWYPKPIAVATLPTPARPLSNPSWSDLFPSWSPDGKWIAFTRAPAVRADSDQAAANQRRIWRMRPDGTDQRQLTHDPAFRDERPQWSADGKTILFARMKGATAQVWLMQADSANPRVIVDALTPAPDWFGYYGYIRWDWLYDWWSEPLLAPSP